ncbi:MAG: FAD-binding oxidoreductase [Chloroflexota bacterium]
MTDQATTVRPTNVDEGAIEAFIASLRGEVIRPGDESYESARMVWNGMIDKHPSLIVRCAGAADVIATVNFGREHGMETAVRGGGHNVAGNAVCDGGLVIDLSSMRSVHVDPARRTAWAEPGCTWGEFDHETQAFGLGTTGGLVTSTGIAGFTLGGGMGWLVRKHGLACDNLRSVDIVTAEGKLINASPENHPDLFWGVRGGGGNFGVVTGFEYQLHPVGPMVFGGAVFHPLERAREVLSFYREFTARAPDELTTMAAIMTAPPAPFIPADLHGKSAIAIASCYAGSMEQGEAAVASLLSFGPPAGAHIGPVPYTMLQSMFDASAPAGLNNYWKSHYLASLDGDATDVILKYATMIPAPFSQIHLHQLGGAMSRTPNGSTAFGHRDAAYALNIIGMWADPAETDRDLQWVRQFWAAMERFSVGVYVNFMAEEDEGTVKSAYDAGAYQRLVTLKRKYDPVNFFHLNQNIKP